jgi:predicted metal-dependent hydrolase
VPRRTSRRHALAWAAGHRDWIEARLAEIPPAVPISSGASIPYRGGQLTIDWQESRPRRISLEEGRLILGGPFESIENRVLRWLKSEALSVLEAESFALAQAVGAKLVRVGVGDPASRWGSCSSSGAIRYSWRLILAPDFVRRATVAHEVAHLVHLNHGPQFHHLVEELLGEDPGPARQWLRRQGASLHQLGRGI